MRKIILMMSVSLDGFFEGPNHEIDWHLVDDELHSHFNEVLSRMSVFLHGRVTYELMAGFWPTADQDPAATAPGSGARCRRSCSHGLWSRLNGTPPSSAKWSPKTS